ncbi:hypothetical protein [Phenylobacterium sp.]|jgi:hypothetical protein|uniref:hypothetical protein n=1 Tax=Phenylobacterium sp. TaxID=1871053 RepID=UPI002F958BA3
MLKHTLAAAAALALTGCATTYALAPIASSNQEVTYDRGAALVMSKKDQGAVRVAPTSTAFEGRMSLGVVAFNDGSSNFNLGTENVQVFTANGTPVRVFTYEQLVKEAKTAAAWQTFAVALSGAANAYAASQPTTVNTYGTAYGSRTGFTNYASTSTVYNPANAALANSINQAQTNRSLSMISRTLDDTLSGLGDSVLRTTTVEPGRAVGGNVIVNKPKFAKGEPQQLRVVVGFAGEEHEFRFALAPS